LSKSEGTIVEGRTVVKIGPCILAAIAIGALSLDGANARQHHGRHHHGGAGVGSAADRASHHGDVARPGSAADEGDRTGKTGTKGPRHDRTGPDSEGAADHRTSVKEPDPDLIFVRPPKNGAQHALKPTRSKTSNPAASRHAIARQPHPRPDLFGTVRNPPGSGTTPGANAALGRRDANGKEKTGPLEGPRKGQVAGFSPATVGAMGGVNAGKVLPVRPSGPVASLTVGGARLSGTGFGRPAAASGALGGPARVLAGVSGTGMRSKH